MRDLKSKVSYLRGLSAGLDLSPDAKEHRLINGIIEVLGEFAESVSELERAQEQLEEYVESIDEDLYSLEDEIYEDGGYSEDDFCEVECPRCGETVFFEKSVIEDGSDIEVLCPNCDEVVFTGEGESKESGEIEVFPGKITSYSDVVGEDDI